MTHSDEYLMDQLLPSSASPDEWLDSDSLLVHCERLESRVDRLKAIVKEEQRLRREAVSCGAAAGMRAENALREARWLMVAFCCLCPLACWKIGELIVSAVTR